MLIVVGGQSRNLGKTSVVAGLIAALRERRWTAVKITQYGHGICSSDGQPCECDTGDHTWGISEERDPAGRADTCRFLAGGAARSLWVRTRQGNLAEAMPSLRQKLQGAENVIIESNSVLKFLRPDLYLTVLDYGTEDFKQSARLYLDRADAIVLSGPGEITPAWSGVSLKLLDGKPQFLVHPPQYVTAELVSFVAGRMAARASEVRTPRAIQD